MDVVAVVWALCAMAALWFLGMGVVRLIAFRAGTDSTRGMQNVARSILGLGLAAVVLFAILGIVLLTR